MTTTSPEKEDRQGILSFFQENAVPPATKRPPKEQESLVELGSGSAEAVEEKQEACVSKRKTAAVNREKLRVAKEQEKQEREAKKKLKELQRQEEKRKREAKLKEEKLKRQQKAEEVKRRREELKLQKELEKQKREQQRLEAKRAKEEARLQREAEKLKKEEAKRIKEEQKERAQSRIGNFFRKVNDSSKQENAESDYQKYFLPFYAKDSVVLAPHSTVSPKDKIERIQRIDAALSDSTATTNDAVIEWLDSRKIQRGTRIAYTAVAVLQQMTSKDKTDEELQQLLAQVPQKYIKFYENIRPPYIGTYSKDVILPVTNPFSKEDTGYNYDYDSDLDWVNEEDEEEGGVDNLESGEDDEDEEEDDDDEASEGEFDGFLDTEDKTGDANSSKRKKFIGPLIPTVHLWSDLELLDPEDKLYFIHLSAEYLIETQPFPIDPYHVIQTSTANSPEKQSNKRLAERSNSTNDGLISNSASPDKKKPKTLITEAKDLLKLFDDIQDSTFSLGTVTEIAQKNLPHYNKQTIKNTVKEYAFRTTGKGDTPRKWGIKDVNHWEGLRRQSAK